MKDTRSGDPAKQRPGPIPPTINKYGPSPKDELAPNSKDTGTGTESGLPRVYISRPTESLKDQPRTLVNEVSPKNSLQNQTKREGQNSLTQFVKFKGSPSHELGDESTRGLPIKNSEKSNKLESLMLKVQQNKSESSDRLAPKKERRNRSPSPVDIRELVELQSQVYQITILKSSGRQSDNEQSSNSRPQSPSPDPRYLRRRDLSETRERHRNGDGNSAKDPTDSTNTLRSTLQNDNSRGTLLNKINQHTIRSKSPQYDPYNYMRAKEGVSNRLGFSEDMSDRTSPGLSPQPAEQRDKPKITRAPIISFRSVGKAPEAKEPEVSPNVKGLESIKEVNENQVQRQEKLQSKPDTPTAQIKKLPFSVNESTAKPENQDLKYQKSNTPTWNKDNSPSYFNHKEESKQAKEQPFPPKNPESFHDKPVLSQFVGNPNNVKSSVMPLLKPDVSGPMSLTGEGRTYQRAKDIDPRVQELLKNRERSPIPEIAEESKQKRSHSEKTNFKVQHSQEFLQGKTKDIISFIHRNSKNLPTLEEVKVVSKPFGPIKCFGVSTHKGTVRNYNEDRVSVLLNAHQKLSSKSIDNTKSASNSYSLFSIFDGHGGNSCCNFLKDKLHSALFEEVNLGAMTQQILTRVYRDLDQGYMNNAIENSLKFSGSCATTLVVQQNGISIINVGDSRVIMSKSNGSETIDLSVDHKPELASEFLRVIENGGELYRISSNTRNGELRHYFARTANDVSMINQFERANQQLIFGPWRIKPGGLSVSRSFGDIESKLPHYGGLGGNVTADPELFHFSLEDTDFVVMGCNLKRRRHLRSHE
jgi:serine/threonine protein phosphatase PrpC